MSIIISEKKKKKKWRITGKQSKAKQSKATQPGTSVSRVRALFKKGSKIKKDFFFFKL